MNRRVFRNAVISLSVLAAAAAMSSIARSGTSSSEDTASVASRLRVYDVSARVTNAVVWGGRDRSAIVVVRFGRRGPIGAERVVLKVRGDRARCPVWSSDSSRLAYLEYGRVVVRDLHGARRHRSDGDPAIRDFDRSVDELVSPSGDLVARRGLDGTIVSRLDGSDQRVIKDGWTAGWSPDGRQLLFWEDVYGAWSRLRAVSVDPPFASETVVDHGAINSPRPRLPGYGDVSWQPKP